VRQVLTNLLGNAVKFTDRGGRVAVTCTITDQPAPDSGLAQGKSWIAFHVEDTGIGINANQLSHIFEPFAQAQSGHTRERGGTGLGLSISRRLARLMGGDITVESTLNVGSRFTLWLRAADGEVDRRPTDDRSAAAASMVHPQDGV
jgi:signal transduction histidine kinase